LPPYQNELGLRYLESTLHFLLCKWRIGERDLGVNGIGIAL
jgi:hypothetical protein